VIARSSPTPADPAARPRQVVALDLHHQPRTYRLSPQLTYPAAYRRLALTILGLDLATLVEDLRTARQHTEHALAHAA
jgi:hypothetical protein